MSFVRILMSALAVGIAFVFLASGEVVQAQQACHPSYTNVCIPPQGGDVDCAGGSGNGPRFVRGPVRVVGSDPYGLDRDGNGWGCE